MLDQAALAERALFDEDVVFAYGQPAAGASVFADAVEGVRHDDRRPLRNVFHYFVRRNQGFLRYSHKGPFLFRFSRSVSTSALCGSSGKTHALPVAAAALRASSKSKSGAM